MPVLQHRWRQGDQAFKFKASLGLYEALSKTPKWGVGVQNSFKLLLRRKCFLSKKMGFKSLENFREEKTLNSCLETQATAL